jgi:uncharacterized iron-regulated membrane protein
MKSKFPLRIRKLHRYLGLVLGIQFMAWTLGGLYFSWSDMDQVHGDHQRKPVPLLASQSALVSPQLVLQNLPQRMPADSLQSLTLIQLLGRPVYQIRLRTASHPHHARVILANALTGEIRSPLSRSEAIRVAAQAFNGLPEVASVEYLTAVNAHHEYREQPLPAYAITFRHPATTVYVATELGTVQKFRNNAWRVFDFLWMLHTMDYQSRDNIGNWLLRVFSIFGLLTIVSGFVLFGVSSKTIRRLRRRKEKATGFPLPATTKRTFNQNQL